MKPVKLGVILDQQIKTGGGFQQALTTALQIQSLSSEVVTPLFYTTIKENIDTLEGVGISAKFINRKFISKVRVAFQKQIQSPYLINKINKVLGWTALETRLVNDGVELVYFLSPSGLERELYKLNYISTVWDLCHRDDPEFPEIRNGLQFEIRESNFRNVLPKATAVIADSELGKTRLLQRYGIDQNRVHIIPFQPAAAVLGRASQNNQNSNSKSIREIYNLKYPYVFYPAQFWSHKNHIYILNVLEALKTSYGIKIGAIFSGSDQGSLRYIQKSTAEMELQDQIRFAGFVDNERLVDLYRQSVCLMMPTYFGPTNIPPLEAFSLGVPVLYSNKAGLKEQVKNAALLMDLSSFDSGVEQLKKLIENNELKQKLIQAGFKLLNSNKVNAGDILTKIIIDFQYRRETWE